MQKHRQLYITFSNVATSYYPLIKSVAVIQGEFWEIA